MIKKYLFLLCSFLSARSLEAQSWMKQFTLDSCSLTAYEVLPYNGDYFVYGTASNNYNNSYFTFLSKIDAQGNPVWTKKYKFSSLEYSSTHGILKSADGNLLFLLKHGNYDFAVMKTDTSGNFLWGKRFYKGFGVALELEGTTTGDIIVSGINMNYSQIYNIFLIRLDANGGPLQYYDFASTYQWSMQMRLGNILKTQDGGCIVTGNMDKTYLDRNIFFAKLDSAGMPTWTISIGSQYQEGATSIAETSDGYIYTGRDRKELLLGKISKNGNPVWNKVYKSIWTPWPQVLVKDGRVEVYSAVALDSNYSLPLRELLFETDTSGNFISSTILADTFTYSNFVFDAKRYGTANDRIILQTGNSGEFKLIKTDDSLLNKCGVPLFPSAIVSGVYPKIVENVCFPDTIMAGTLFAWSTPVTLKQENACNCALLCLGSTTLLNEIQLSNKVLISPNPSHGLFTLSGIDIASEINIFSSVGVLIYSSRTKEKEIQVDLSDKPNGVYFVELVSDKARSIQKLIIQ
jgi:hypothetical protein